MRKGKDDETTDPKPTRDNLERTRLARECAKLDPKFEMELAEQGIEEDLEQWPEY